MIAFKCKMCGGDLHPEESNTTCECEFCGTVQTIPTDDGEKKTNLFNRANRLRMNAEFDKAATVYESIAAEFPEEAEAYWGLCLCAYGIEYVDDPGTGEKKPTCHRTLPTSIMEDSNFDQACENADPIARRVYREEAKEIDQIQKDILAIVSNEQPYDAFICYKETAEEGGRTEDSVLAQEIYDALTDKGLKVFFARITLEDKLGQQYEPYIYAALTSSKVMLAVGTKFEYYDAVWVKNEWMRFLSMMKTDKSKALIPCYKGLDAYDMPKEFKNLQAQDMSKIGWLQDLTRGVEKLLGPKNEPQIVASDSNTIQTENYIKRIKLFIESKDWDKAIDYCEKALDTNPENAQAYLLKELSERKCSDISELARYIYLRGDSKCESLKNARRFADPETRIQLDELDNKINSASSELKKAFDEYMAKELSLPNYQEKKDRLKYVRDRAKILSKRVYAGMSHTFVLDTDGKMSCTTTTDDQYGVYDGGKSACRSWNSRLYSFVENYDFLYGCTINGKVIRTNKTTRENTDSVSKDPKITEWINISKWSDVKEIIDGESIAYGIMGDGTVSVVGKWPDSTAYHGQDKVEHLKNISSFETYNGILCRCLFLSKEGTVQSSEYVGEDKYADVWDDMSNWTDITQLINYHAAIAGLRSDGTVVCTRCFGEPEEPELLGALKEIKNWSGIVQLEDSYPIFGLSETGKIYATEYYDDDFDDEDDDDEEETKSFREVWEQVKNWTDIAYLYFPGGKIIGITADGEVRYADYNEDDELYRSITKWRNIVSLHMEYKRIAGVKKDGSLVYAGDDYHGSSNVTGLSVFNDYANIPNEISKGIAAEKKRKSDAQIEKRNLINELSNLKGLFSGKRRKEIQDRLAEIDAI